MAKSIYDSEEGGKLEEFLKKNMPTLRQLDPVEFKKLVKTGEVLADKYAERASQLLRKEGVMPEAGIGAAAATGGVTLAATIAGRIIDRKTGG